MASLGDGWQSLSHGVWQTVRISCICATMWCHLETKSHLPYSNLNTDCYSSISSTVSVSFLSFSFCLLLFILFHTPLKSLKWIISHCLSLFFYFFLFLHLLLFFLSLLLLITPPNFLISFIPTILTPSHLV